MRTLIDEGDFRTLLDWLRSQKSGVLALDTYNYIADHHLEVESDILGELIYMLIKKSGNIEFIILAKGPPLPEGVRAEGTWWSWEKQNDILATIFYELYKNKDLDILKAMKQDGEINELLNGKFGILLIDAKDLAKRDLSIEKAITYVKNRNYKTLLQLLGGLSGVMVTPAKDKLYLLADYIVEDNNIALLIFLLENRHNAGVVEFFRGYLIKSIVQGDNVAFLQTIMDYAKANKISSLIKDLRDPYYLELASGAQETIPLLLERVKLVDLRKPQIKALSKIFNDKNWHLLLEKLQGTDNYQYAKDLRE
jgi:hypothetical protein